MAYSNCELNTMFTLTKTIIINISSWLILVPLTFVCILYRNIINLILKIQLTDEYGGLLDRRDAFFCVPDRSKCCITTVLYIKSEKKIDLLSSLKKIFEKEVFEHPERYPKLTSTCHSLGGYPYWIKNDCDVNDAILPLNIDKLEALTEERLKRITAEITNRAYSKNGTVLWDIHVSQEPLELSSKDNFFRYPVIARFHHSIADGTSLVALFIKLFGDKKSQNYGYELFRNLSDKNSTGHQKNVFESMKFQALKIYQIICIYLEAIFLSLGRLIESDQLRIDPDENALHGDNYSGNKIAAWATEDNIECIPSIKRTKNIRKSKFTCVINTAMSASITNYLKRTSSYIPDEITGGISVLVNIPSLDPSQSVHLENNATGLLYKIPTTHKYASLLEVLEHVTDRMNKRIRYADILVLVVNVVTFSYHKYAIIKLVEVYEHNFPPSFLAKMVLNIKYLKLMAKVLIQNFVGYFPLQLLVPTLGLNKNTFVITNVPGGSQVKLFDGCVLEKVIPICPNFRNIGISFALLSYNDRLNVGVLIDESLNVSQDDAQKIADDVITFIKQLDEETKEPL